jgi:hypothetical protein
MAVVRTVFAAGRKLVAQISRVLEGERRHRAAIEQELFCGRYMLASKNDDDLPIPSGAGAVRLPWRGSLRP